jgi:hypothetical protein
VSSDRTYSGQKTGIKNKTELGSKLVALGGELKKRKFIHAKMRCADIQLRTGHCFVASAFRNFGLAPARNSSLSEREHLLALPRDEGALFKIATLSTEDLASIGQHR